MNVAATIDNSAARRAMIDSQLRVSGVTDPAVVAAMAAVAREDHVPAAARGHAYIDRAIPLGGGRSLAAPLVQGLMLREAVPSASDRCLVVSGGSSYLAALVEAMGASVEAIDAADAAAGKASGAGYTLLLIDGAVEHIPAELVTVLGQGCRVVTGLTDGKVTHLATGSKNGSDVKLRSVADLGIPVLKEFAAAKNWSF